MKCPSKNKLTQREFAITADVLTSFLSEFARQNKDLFAPDVTTNDDALRAAFLKMNYDNRVTRVRKTLRSFERAGVAPVVA